MGIFPFQIRLKWISKIYTVILMTALISLHFCVVVYRNTENLTKFEDTLQICSFLVPGCFYAQVVISNFTIPDSWQRIFIDITSFDHLYQKELKRNTSSKSKSTFKLLAIIFLSILYSTVYSYVIIKSLPNLLLRFYIPFPLHFTLFYEVNVAAFFYELSFILQSRYQYLQNWLKKIIYNKRCLQIKTTNKEFQDFMQSYKLLFNATKATDAVLGTLISYIILHNVTRLLASFYWYLVIHGSSQSWGYYVIQCYLALIISLVSIY